MWHLILCHDSSYVWDLVPAHLVIMFAPGSWYPEIRVWHPGIKDGIGFQKGDNVKLNAPPKKLSNFVKDKAPMPQDNEGYILYPVGYPEDKIRRIHSRKLLGTCSQMLRVKNKAT
jgi:hypothetical protein